MAVAAEWRRLQKKCLLWLLVAAVWSCASAEVRSQKEKEVGLVTCQVAPPWTAPVVSGDGLVEDEEERSPMQEGRGKVLAVVLTSASSQHSLDQAEKLEALESHFHDNSMPDVKFILVNSAQSRGYLPNLLSKNLTISIYQENANKSVWTTLGGKKDYIFVYDRCGQLTYKIPFPLSIIHPRKTLVEAIVTSTYQDDICGDQNCNVSDTNQAVDLKGDSDEVKEDNTQDSDTDELRGNNGPEASKNNTNDIRGDSDEVKEDNTEDSDTDDLRGSNGTEGSKNNVNEIRDARLEQLFKSRKEGKPYRHEAPTTAAPSLLNGLRSLYHKVMKHMPWASKDKKEERYINSVRRFLDKEKPEENIVATELPEESQNDMCNETDKSICRAWTKKKLDHARICCNLHTCNRSAQYLQKHCIHYTEHRCKKVELVMKCCHNDRDNGSHTDEQANTRASVSSHPKS